MSINEIAKVTWIKNLSTGFITHAKGRLPNKIYDK